MAVEVRTFRPIKLLAVLFDLLGWVLLAMAVGAGNWVDVQFRSGDGARQAWGLWQRCYSVNDAWPTVCVHYDWLASCGGLSVIAMVSCVVSILLGLVGLCAHKRNLYVAAGIISIIGALAQLIALVVYPIKFSEDILVEQSQVQRWDFDWTYGVGWGGFCFILAAGIFFLVQQDSPPANKAMYHAQTTYYINHT